jgi:hypothetical protein
LNPTYTLIWDTNPRSPPSFSPIGLRTAEKFQFLSVPDYNRKTDMNRRKADKTIKLLTKKLVRDYYYGTYQNHSEPNMLYMLAHKKQQLQQQTNKQSNQQTSEPIRTIVSRTCYTCRLTKTHKVNTIDYLQ